MTDTSLVPYSLQMPALPAPETRMPLEPGQVQGVIITLPAEETLAFFAQMDRWFADRPEVGWVETGVSAKAEQGYVILEWDACEIDPLFLSILNDDEQIIDYLLYTREKETCR